METDWYFDNMDFGYEADDEKVEVQKFRHPVIPRLDMDQARGISILELLGEYGLALPTQRFSLQNYHNRMDILNRRLDQIELLYPKLYSFQSDVEVKVDTIYSLDFPIARLVTVNAGGKSYTCDDPLIRSLVWREVEHSFFGPTYFDEDTQALCIVHIDDANRIQYYLKVRHGHGYILYVRNIANPFLAMSSFELMAELFTYWPNIIINSLAWKFQLLYGDMDSVHLGSAYKQILL